jgi:hypothetical protein
LSGHEVGESGVYSGNEYNAESRLHERSEIEL